MTKTNKIDEQGSQGMSRTKPLYKRRKGKDLETVVKKHRRGFFTHRVGVKAKARTRWDFTRKETKEKAQKESRNSALSLGDQKGG